MCEQCGWEKFVGQIDGMLESRRYRFASGTLESIKRTVEKNRHATDGQAAAVQNIEDSAR